MVEYFIGLTKEDYKLFKELMRDLSEFIDKKNMIDHYIFFMGASVNINKFLKNKLSKNELEKELEELKEFYISNLRESDYPKDMLQKLNEKIKLNEIVEFYATNKKLDELKNVISSYSDIFEKCKNTYTRIRKLITTESANDEIKEVIKSYSKLLNKNLNEIIKCSKGDTIDVIKKLRDTQKLYEEKIEKLIVK